MSQPEIHERALKYLTAGDFARAREDYGDLVENDPDNLEYICGFYTAGYWDNRKDRIGKLKPGRSRGDYLIKEWESYSNIATERNFPGCTTYVGAMKAILGMASEQFRVAFQEEGGAAVDGGVLEDLGRCLIRIEEYQQASEIMQYAVRMGRSEASLFFLLGESLASMEDERSRKRGWSYYRDAGFIDPQKIDPALIGSEPASKVFGILYQARGENLERALEWMPAYLLSETFVAELRKLHPEEVEQLIYDCRRLNKERARVDERFADRVNARLSFYLLTLIHHYTFHEPIPDAVREFEDQLKEMTPALYQIYRDRKKK